MLLQMIRFTFSKQTHKTTATNKDLQLVIIQFIFFFFSSYFQGVPEVQVAPQTIPLLPSSDQSKNKHFVIWQPQ